MRKYVLIIVIAIIAILGISCVTGYNKLVTLNESVTKASSDIDVVLQRRADLIPNLVNVVKGFTKHETEIIDKVTDARTKLVNAGSMSEKAKANDELSTSLNGLLAIVENYPDLKSSQNFIQLSDELAGTENRIAVARKDYNEKANDYNTAIKRFPNSIIASLFNFDKAEYFETTENNTTVPVVNFNE